MRIIIEYSTGGKYKKFIEGEGIDSSGEELDLQGFVSKYSEDELEELEKLEKLNMELEEAVKKRIKENGRIGRVYH